MTATFFAKNNGEYIRVSTSVPKPDGTGRATGTILNPTGEVIAAIREGMPFYGEGTILGVPYTTGYAFQGRDWSSHRDLLCRLSEITLTSRS